MASVHFEVKYYRFIPGSKGAKTSTDLSGTVSNQSEELVMQILRKKHKGEEIELRKLEWK